MPYVRRAIAALLIAALPAAAMTGCGSDETAADAVPALAQRLDAVDTAIDSGDLTGAAEAVDRLIDETTRAREDGRLDQAAAAEVIEAAERLLDELETEAEPDQSTLTRTPEPSEGDGEEGTDEGKQDREDEEEKPDKDDEGDDEGRGNGENEGGGNGPSSGNGPADGHGD